MDSSLPSAQRLAKGATACLRWVSYDRTGISGAGRLKADPLHLDVAGGSRRYTIPIEAGVKGFFLIR